MTLVQIHPQPLAKSRNLKTETREELNEIDIGEWTNLTMDEIHDAPGWKEWNEFRSCACPPGGREDPRLQNFRHQVCDPRRAAR